MRRRSESRRTALALGWIALAIALVGASLASAQGRVERPGDRGPEVPSFPDADPPAPLLPPLRDSERPTDRAGGGLRIEVVGFRFEDNTVFDDDALATVVAPWTGRALTASGLRSARDAVTRHYVDAGYRSSGAVLIDQPIRDGIVTLRVVEGRLVDVRIRGNRRYRTDPLRARLLREAGQPLRLSALERAIRRL